MRTLRYAVLSKLAQRWDFRLYALNMPWHRNAAFRRAWDGFPDLPNRIQDRRFNLYNLAKLFTHVPGDLAECGVHGGRTSHLLLTACPGKHLHGFDSFEGVSAPTLEDRANGTHWKAGTFANPEEQTVANLALHDGRFTLYRGWIPDRFDVVADRSFAIVHIDVDQYQPTKDSIEFFWPRLSPGGLLVCDDYGSVSCPGARKAIDQFGVPVAELSSGQAVLIKPCGA